MRPNKTNIYTRFFYLKFTYNTICNKCYLIFNLAMLYANQITLTVFMLLKGITKKKLQNLTKTALKLLEKVLGWPISLWLKN